METRITEADAAIHSVPTYDPASGEPIERPKGAWRQSRREFVRLALAVMGGIGLAFSDLVSSPFVRHATATPCTGSGCYLSHPTSCRGYYSSSQICVPTSAYFGRDNCDAADLAHWHKNHATDFWTAGSYDYKAHYEHWAGTCDGRNAWVWIATKTMCSDGQKTRWVYDNGQWVEQMDSFSICRTTA
jgi:hypothetical protein